VRRDAWDVVVVGAGPAGGMAAWTAARMGLRTLLVEEHPRVGEPAHCAGKLSVHAFRAFDLPTGLARATLRAATVYAPDGRSVHLRRSVPDSYVVDRDVFDRWLVDRAVQAGAELLVGARAAAVARERGSMLLEIERRGGWMRIRTPVVIDAEGARARLAAQAGLWPRRRFVRGLQYELTGVDLFDPETAELYLGRRWAPGFFAWLMPLGERTARVGLCVDPASPRPPAAYLEDLLRNHPALAPRVRAARLVRRLGGWIPICVHPHPTYRPGFLAVGDAAGQVKATSGGGIYFSLVAGRLGAQAAAGFLAGRRDAFQSYERTWRAHFGREVRFTAWMRAALDRLSDEEISHFLSGIADHPSLQRAIADHGDTQYQSHLFVPVLTSAVRAGIRDRAFGRTVARTAGALLRALAHLLRSEDLQDTSERGREE
jgi:digeranylgeranylglycerophospholipid reductase